VLEPCGCVLYSREFSYCFADHFPWVGILWATHTAVNPPQGSSQNDVDDGNHVKTVFWASLGQCRVERSRLGFGSSHWEVRLFGCARLGATNKASPTRTQLLVYTLCSVVLMMADFSYRPPSEWFGAENLKVGPRLT